MMAFVLNLTGMPCRYALDLMLGLFRFIAESEWILHLSLEFELVFGLFLLEERKTITLQ